MSEIVDWKTAAASICNAMQERATQVATRASEDLYEHMMLSVQDYLRDNVRFNLSAEILGKNSEIARLKDEKANRDALFNEAVEALEEARAGLCAYTGGPDGACGCTVAKVDAILSKIKAAQASEDK